MAVIEGVLLRQGRRYAIAVRAPDGTICVQEGSTPGWAARTERLPLVRGVAALAESMALGVRALGWSVGQREPDLRAAKPPSVGRTLALAIVLVAAVFFVFPATVARLVAGSHGTLVFTLVEAALRVGILLAYLWGISRLRDVQRLFGYHGAEHMVVNAHEAHAPASVEAVAGFGTRHVRCGTTFMMLVMVLAVGAHAIPSSGGWVGLLASRVVALPLIAGLAYEVLRAAADRVALRWLLAPGLALQALTARTPDRGQLEVAVVALRAVLAEPVETVPTAPLVAAVSN